MLRVHDIAALLPLQASKVGTGDERVTANGSGATRKRAFVFAMLPAPATKTTFARAGAAQVQAYEKNGSSATDAQGTSGEAGGGGSAWLLAGWSWLPFCHLHQRGEGVVMMMRGGVTASTAELCHAQPVEALGAHWFAIRPYH